MQIDKVYVINLKRRQDRQDNLWKAIAATDWPFPAPALFPAIEGDAIPLPEYWRGGGGARGCLLSHTHILEQAWSDRLKTILVLEDDAMFVPKFGEQVKQFLAAVPTDWECLMIGGQDHAPPTRINDHVARSMNCQRTHAIIWRMQSRLVRDFYRALQTWHTHLDHQLGKMLRNYKVYQPHPHFLVGQVESKSDIFGKDLGNRWWSKVPADLRYKGTMILLHAERDVALGLREKGWHQGYWCDPVTSVDNGLRKILRGGETDMVLELREWIDLVGNEVKTNGHLCVWHPKMTRQLLEKAAPDNKIVEVRGSTVEECLALFAAACSTPSA